MQLLHDFACTWGQAARDARRNSLKHLIMLRFLSCKLRCSAWGPEGAIGRPGGIAMQAAKRIKGQRRSILALSPTYLNAELHLIAEWFLAGEFMAGIPDEQYIVDAEGKRKGVILSIERYEQLTEDLHDLAVVAERREEECISLDEMKRRLKQDGIL
jgi:hypothetical protein